MFTKILFAVILIALLLTACGGSLATMANIPIYPDVKEISPSESGLFAGLTQIAKNDQALQRILTGKERKIYRLPNNAVWADVKLYYEKQMDKAQWQIVPGSSALLERVNLPSDISAYQTTTWVRGSQTLSIAFVTSPGFVELFVGLASP